MGQVRFYPYKKGDGKSFSHAEGGHRKALSLSHTAGVCVGGGGGGTTRFHPLNGGSSHFMNPPSCGLYDRASMPCNVGHILHVASKLILKNYAEIQSNKRSWDFSTM